MPSVLSLGSCHCSDLCTIAEDLWRHSSSLSVYLCLFEIWTQFKSMRRSSYLYDNVKQTLWTAGLCDVAQETADLSIYQNFDSGEMWAMQWGYKEGMRKIAGGGGSPCKCQLRGAPCLLAFRLFSIWKRKTTIPFIMCVPSACFSTTSRPRRPD